MLYFGMIRSPHISKNRATMGTTGIPIASNIQFSKTNLIKAIGPLPVFHRHFNEEGSVHHNVDSNRSPYRIFEYTLAFYTKATFCIDWF
jgi:hypothetical protein